MVNLQKFLRPVGHSGKGNYTFILSGQDTLGLCRHTGSSGTSRIEEELDFGRSKNGGD